MKYKLIYIFLLFASISCVSFHYTDVGGLRVEDPSVFAYNKPKFKNLDKSLIDTNSLYVLDSIFNKWDSIQGIKIESDYLSIIRFFPDGQVLFIYCDSILTAECVNNKEAGIQGYFYIDENRIKIDMFQNLNYGQTGKRFGIILDKETLMLYNQRPETYNLFRFSQLEKDGKKSFYKKVNMEDLELYKPDW